MRKVLSYYILKSKTLMRRQETKTRELKKCGRSIPLKKKKSLLVKTGSLCSKLNEHNIRIFVKKENDIVKE